MSDHENESRLTLVNVFDRVSEKLIALVNFKVQRPPSLILLAHRFCELYVKIDFKQERHET